MDRRHSEYRGWTLAVAPMGRRKLLGHAARREPSHKLVTAEGWGDEETALRELRRQIDEFEDRGAGSPQEQPG